MTIFINVQDHDLNILPKVEEFVDSLDETVLAFGNVDESLLLVIKRNEGTIGLNPSYPASNDVTDSIIHSATSFH
jgi:hypothetical protein